MAEVKIPKTSLNQEKKINHETIKPVVKQKATLTPNEKSFKVKLKESLTGSDVGSVGDYLIFQVLVPTVKNTLVSLISNGAEMLLLGGTQNTNDRRRSNQYVSYNSINSSRYYPPAAPQPKNSEAHYHDISFWSKDDAETVLYNMCDYIDTYGYVDVATYYSLGGKSATSQDTKWGWYNLGGVKAIPSREEPGRWILSLPKVTYLD